MKKTIFSYCILASTVLFSSPLYAGEEECNKEYMRQVFVRSEWQNNRLVDSKKVTSYTVLDVATNTEVGTSPQERQDLEYSKVQFTQFDPKTNTCTVTILRQNGGNLTMLLTPHPIE
jgi:hypothetical protein